MIWIIIAIVGFIIIRFLSDWGKQNAKLSIEGGVRKKYSKLIELLQVDSPSPTVFQSDWITPNADQRFRIMQTFGSVTIKWQFVGQIVFEKINLSKEWKFPENADQEKMAAKIVTEMGDIANNSGLGGF